MLITLQNLSFAYEDNYILKNLSATLEDGDRVGLIGENGCGKTTLINLLAGRLFGFDGEVSLKRDLSIGYLEQGSGLNSELTVLEEMRLTFSDILGWEKRMREIEQEFSLLTSHESEEYRALSNEYNDLKKKFEGLDGYNIDVKIKTILNGMGFINLYSRQVNSFSGGEKTRLAICKLLLQAPDLLILDEPTNHLDFETLSWLENYLSTFKGALLIVSHDRFFLDNTVNKIWELEDKQISVWRGNYTKYKELKKEYIEATTKEWEKQQVEIAKMEDYVARNLVRATTSKSAQSRVKKLDSLERIEKPKTFKKPPYFHFEKGLDPTKEVLNVYGLDLFAGDKKLFEKGEFQVLRGEKVAIVGENGTGKSTLLKAVLDAFNTLRPEIRFGKNIGISYYDQENLNLNFKNTVLSEMWDKFPRATVYDLRKALGRMLFEEEDMEKRISVLSGGERARLGFAIMTMKTANFLILDEPTNHIDLLTREALENALKEFDGTVLFVSHDRYFLNAVATKVVEIKGELTTYNYGFEKYLSDRKDVWSKLARENALDAPEEVVKEKPKNTYKNAKEKKEEAKNKLKLKEIEAEISALEEKESLINQEISQPQVSSDYILLTQKLNELEQIKTRLDELLSSWSDLAEMLTK